MCAGIKHGIDVAHKLDTVTWQLSEPKPTQNFVFSQSDYNQAFRKLKNQGNGLIDYLQKTEDLTLEIVPNRNAEFFNI